MMTLGPPAPRSVLSPGRTRTSAANREPKCNSSCTTSNCRSRLDGHFQGPSSPSDALLTAALRTRLDLLPPFAGADREGQATAMSGESALMATANRTPDLLLGCVGARVRRSTECVPQAPAHALTLHPTPAPHSEVCHVHHAQEKTDLQLFGREQ